MKLILPSRRWLYLFGCLWTAAVMTLCVFYLTHSQEALLEWFTGLQPCFYRPDHWASHFFTPAAKAAGNRFCMAGLSAGLPVLVLLLRKLLRRGSWWSAVAVDRKHLLPALLLLLAGSLLWLWAHTHIRPNMDEVFSAVHIGEPHPFQGLAYYMLPNNHLLFNAVNNAFFHYSGDQLLTGRIVAGIAYLATLLLLYGWLYGRTGQRWPAVFSALVLGLFYPVWGFGAQARGYSMLVLFGWAAFVFLSGYLRGGGRRDLRVHTFAVVAGYAVMPTFLYLHAAMVLWAALHQLGRQRLDRQLLAYLAAAAVAVFLFYLPALCFSGLPAFTANEYVRPMNLAAGEYATEVGRLSAVWAGYVLRGRVDAPAAGAEYLLFLLPLLLAGWRRDRPEALFLLLLWAVLYAFVFAMQRYPPVRGLLVHFHFLLAFALLAVYRLVRLPAQGRLIWLYPVLLVPVAAQFLLTGRERLAATLYNFDINEYGRLLELNLRDLPPGASVGCSDESFYLYYIGNKRGFRMVKCSSGAEAYYIRLEEEALPQPADGRYEKRWDRGDYRVYEKVK